MIELIELIKTFGVAFYFLSVTSALEIVLGIKALINMIFKFMREITLRVALSDIGDLMNVLIELDNDLDIVLAEEENEED